MRRHWAIIMPPMTTSAGAAAWAGTIAGDRREQQRGAEQGAGDDAGQAGAGAFADAGRRLQEDGVGRGTGDAARDRAGAVDQQDPAHAGDLAVLSVSPASSETLVIVPIASKNPDSTRVNRNTVAGIGAGRGEAAEQVDVAEQGEVGRGD